MSIIPWGSGRSRSRRCGDRFLARRRGKAEVNVTAVTNPIAVQQLADSQLVQRCKRFAFSFPISKVLLLLVSVAGFPLQLSTASNLVADENPMRLPTADTFEKSDSVEQSKHQPFSSSEEDFPWTEALGHQAYKKEILEPPLLAAELTSSADRKGSFTEPTYAEDDEGYDAVNSDAEMAHAQKMTGSLEDSWLRTGELHSAVDLSRRAPDTLQHHSHGMSLEEIMASISTAEPTPTAEGNKLSRQPTYAEEDEGYDAVHSDAELTHAEKMTRGLENTWPTTGELPSAIDLSQKGPDALQHDTDAMSLEASMARISQAEENALKAGVSPAEEDTIKASFSPAEGDSLETSVRPAERDMLEASVSPTEADTLEASVLPAKGESLGASGSPAEEESLRASVSPGKEAGNTGEQEVDHVDEQEAETGMPSLLELRERQTRDFSLADVVVPAPAATAFERERPKSKEEVAMSPTANQELNAFLLQTLHGAMSAMKEALPDIHDAAFAEDKEPRPFVEDELGVPELNQKSHQEREKSLSSPHTSTAPAKEGTQQTLASPKGPRRKVPTKKRASENLRHQTKEKLAGRRWKQAPEAEEEGDVNRERKTRSVARSKKRRTLKAEGLEDGNRIKQGFSKHFLQAALLGLVAGCLGFGYHYKRTTTLQIEQARVSAHSPPKGLTAKTSDTCRSSTGCCEGCC